MLTSGDIIKTGSSFLVALNYMVEREVNFETRIHSPVEMVRAVVGGGRIYSHFGGNLLNSEFIDALRWARAERDALIRGATDPVLLVKGTEHSPLLEQDIFSQLIHLPCRTSTPPFLVVETEKADATTGRPPRYLLYLEIPYKPLSPQEKPHVEDLTRSSEEEIQALAEGEIFAFTNWANMIEESPKPIQEPPPLEMTSREYMGMVKRADRQGLAFNYLDSTELLQLYAQGLRKWARPTSSGIAESVDELLNLALLEADWDSYGGQPPSPRALRQANRLLLRADKLFSVSAQDRIRPFAVVPLASGGVQMEWRTNRQDVEVEVKPTGALSYSTVIHTDRGDEYKSIAEVSQDTTLEVIRQTIL